MYKTGRGGEKPEEEEEEEQRLTGELSRVGGYSVREGCKSFADGWL